MLFLGGRERRQWDQMGYFGHQFAKKKSFYQNLIAIYNTFSRSTVSTKRESLKQMCFGQLITYITVKI